MTGFLKKKKKKSPDVSTEPFDLPGSDFFWGELASLHKLLMHKPSVHKKDGQKIFAIMVQWSVRAILDLHFVIHILSPILRVKFFHYYSDH